MRQIKLSGRESAVLRAIDFSLGTSGADIVERTSIDPDEVADILNGLIELGYAETVPPTESVTTASLPATMFEVNPSYAQELKAFLVRRL